MKKMILMGCVLATMFSCTTVDSSEVAVVVDQIGNDKGIPKTQLKSGWVWYFPPTQDVIVYPTNVQHKEWCRDTTSDNTKDEHIDVTSADGATFKLDVALNLQVIRNHADSIYIKYKVPLKEMIETRIHTIVRKSLLDNAVYFASDSLLQHRNIYENNVNKNLEKLLLKEGFILNNLAVIHMEIPDSYREAIATKIKVIQETATVKSQTIKAEAQALQKVATAKGDYEAALYQAKTKEVLSQPKMLELYRAETDRVWAEKGVSPYGTNNIFGIAGNVLLNRK